MTSEKITYNDVLEYEKLFALAPPFLLERFAKKNSNLVSKFKSQIQSHIANLTTEQKEKLNLILSADINDLQAILNEAYEYSHKKQYKILANPKYKSFIESNLNEIKKLI